MKFKLYQGTMFNKEELEFIRRNSEEDLVNIRMQIANSMDFIIKHSAELTRLKDLEKKLDRIQSKAEIVNECRKDEGTNR